MQQVVQQKLSVGRACRPAFAWYSGQGMLCVAYPATPSQVRVLKASHAVACRRRRAPVCRSQEVLAVHVGDGRRRPGAMRPSVHRPSGPHPHCSRCAPPLPVPPRHLAEFPIYAPPSEYEATEQAARVRACACRQDRQGHCRGGDAQSGQGAQERFEARPAHAQAAQVHHAGV